MASYPKWLYHPSQPALIVKDEAEHKALGPGWVASPADFAAELTPPPKPEPKPAAPVVLEFEVKPTKKAK